MPKQKRQRHFGPTERDRLILEHVARYRLTTVTALQRMVLQQVSRNSVARIARRLCDAGMLQKYTLFHPMNYYVLGESAARSFGLAAHRATPLGSQSLPQEFALLAFSTLGTNLHFRLNSLEIRRRYPFLPLSLTVAPHCLDQEDVLELIRVDLGGAADHVARKCAADLEGRCRIPEFLQLIASRRFRLVVITATPGKVAAIQRALQHHTWPAGLLVHFSVVPQLFSLGASTNHA